MGSCKVTVLLSVLIHPWLAVSVQDASVHTHLWSVRSALLLSGPQNREKQQDCKRRNSLDPSLLYLSILNKLCKKKMANPARPLQLTSRSTYAVTEETSQSDCTKKDAVRCRMVTTGSTPSPILREKSFTTSKNYCNQVLRQTIDPLTYKFCNCTERPGVTGRVGMQELWTELK